MVIEVVIVEDCLWWKSLQLLQLWQIEKIESGENGTDVAVSTVSADGADITVVVVVIAERLCGWKSLLVAKVEVCSYR